ncbi:hypothetical protein DFQ14_10536 [Halopolyspora algeriensis]|uniref:Uncharacterized protein n=1 Tax=Halopolyspora algeriensis TaxID=1500506 RepID=A0A368VS00_9ACTN|nr:helix-turn-helix domain-containing protein [Halopolyspora algeriensis]RCW43895.1 hypothetical protein DFQ14_10536 [Halopolyspora algeriensis]TQM53602.1 hypothetical protein FHU43_1763 [Halopolyspora algeriensis]
MAGPESGVPTTAPSSAGPARVQHNPPELARLLRTGPFDEALRAAIRASRLSLERIQHRLNARGTPVSITALSYWQSGRRRPERPDSLRALQELEKVLNVAEGSLSALLGPPRPRGRIRAAGDAPPLSSLWSDSTSAVELLAQVDTSHDSNLTRLSQHDVVHVDGDGAQVKARMRQLVQAERNGVDRWVTVFDSEGTDVAPPTVRALRSCRLGRVRTDHTQGVVVAELLFDRTLERGETVLMEYEVVPAPETRHLRNRDHTYSRRFRLPIREYVLELQFDPDRPPLNCESYVAHPDGQETEPPKPLTIDRYGRTHAVALDLGLASFCARWEPAPGGVPGRWADAAAAAPQLTGPGVRPH